MYASDYRRIAREKLAGCWGVSIGAWLVAALLGGVVCTSNISFRFDEETIRYLSPTLRILLLKLTVFGSLLTLAQLIIGGVVRQGYCAFLLNQQDGRELHVSELFSQFHRFGDGFVLSLLETLYIILWGLLFVIPGIIAAYRYAMAPYIMLEHPDMGASEAIFTSGEMMRGHKWQLFCLHLSFLGWCFLCVLTLGIGTLWLSPYMEAATTAFYRDISASK